MASPRHTPDSIVESLPKAIEQLILVEKPVLDAARGPDFSIEKLLEVWQHFEGARAAQPDQ